MLEMLSKYDIQFTDVNSFNTITREDVYEPDVCGTIEDFVNENESTWEVTVIERTREWGTTLHVRIWSGEILSTLPEDLAETLNELGDFLKVKGVLAASKWLLELSSISDVTTKCSLLPIQEIAKELTEENFAEDMGYSIKAGISTECSISSLFDIYRYFKDYYKFPEAGVAAMILGVPHQTYTVCEGPNAEAEARMIMADYNDKMVLWTIVNGMPEERLCANESAQEWFRVNRIAR